MKKILILLILNAFITLNVNADTDGEQALSKKETEPSKDCFTTLNRGMFAFNKGLDNIIFQTPTFGEKFLPFMPENMSNKEAIKSFNDSLNKRNLLLNDDGASLKNGQGEILAAIDASNNSQHMHETNVSGLTSYTNLNVAPFMGVNQVA